MPGWRITKWSTEHGRGAISSGAIGEVEFDAAVADVADFTLGEEVDVTLERAGARYRVVRIAPVAWRVPASPPTPPDRFAMLDPVIAAVRDRTLCLRDFDGDDLFVAIEPESYEAERSVVFHACAFVSMPPRFEDVATISAFDATAFAQSDPKRTEGWPHFDDGMTVFRIEPRYHGQIAAFVVAWKVSLRDGPSGSK